MSTMYAIEIHGRLYAQFHSVDRWFDHLQAPSAYALAHSVKGLKHQCKPQAHSHNVESHEEVT
jgi:hypothetical protein